MGKKLNKHVLSFSEGSWHTIKTNVDFLFNLTSSKYETNVSLPAKSLNFSKRKVNYQGIRTFCIETYIISLIKQTLHP